MPYATRRRSASRSTCDSRPPGVVLHVRDDGRGFDPTARLDGARVHHFGLVGMSERAQAVDGEVQVETRLGHGTDVVCRLPYHCRQGGSAQRPWRTARARRRVCERGAADTGPGRGTTI
jgi:signal transduction histidine kinase